MFGRETITLGIGPHSSLLFYLMNILIRMNLKIWILSVAQ